MDTGVRDARAAFERRAWRDAYAQLETADREAGLEVHDLERWAITALLVGADSESADIWTRAHDEWVRHGAPERAARCAFWLGFGLLSRGEAARGAGWLARAQKLVDEAGPDCAARGYLLVPHGLGCLGDGDPAAALAAFVEAGDLAARFGDQDLLTLARMGRGQALIALGSVSEAVGHIDEAIVAVTAGEVSPLVMGIVYCAAIEACQDIFDLSRAQEWTAALDRWCASQPDLVPYRGQCLIHRTEIMAMHGAWPDAADEARRACDQLAGEPAVGDAFYQRAELHRLLGEHAAADSAYREATRWGREPQPGLALLRLAQGQPDAAAAGIRRVVDEARGPVARSRVLGPFVQIMVAVGDVAAARGGADELGALAATLDAPYVHALAGHATGGVLVAEGDSRAALPVLRAAWTAWRALEAPYEAARVRVLIGLACRALGDTDTAEMELDAARLGFEQLGASTDVARVEALARPERETIAAGLTGREMEVLALVAKGRTNREISAALVISEHTVARHVQNICAKLGVYSRTAATSFAYEHHLV